MKKFINKIKSAFSSSEDEEAFEGEEKEEGYVELNTEDEEVKSKIIVRPFVIESFEDIKPILDDLRDGHTICIVNIRPLKDKDMVELKRAINKLKKTTDAVEGEIAGFGEDYVIITPSFARIYRSKQENKEEEKAQAQKNPKEENDDDEISIKEVE